MKMRISIIPLGLLILGITGCSGVKSALNGHENSRFANPARRVAANGTLPAVAEAPVVPDTHTANAGGTGIYSMTGASAPETWGGAFSTR